MTGTVTLDGKTLEQSLGDLVGSSVYRNTLTDSDVDDTGSRLDVIRKYVGAYRELARLELFKEQPDLGRQFYAQDTALALKKVQQGPRKCSGLDLFRKRNGFRASVGAVGFAYGIYFAACLVFLFRQREYPSTFPNPCPNWFHRNQRGAMRAGLSRQRDLNRCFGYQFPIADCRGEVIRGFRFDSGPAQTGPCKNAFPSVR